MKWTVKWGSLALAAMLALTPVSARAQDEDMVDVGVEGDVEVVVEDEVTDPDAQMAEEVVTDEVMSDEAMDAEAMDAGAEGEEVLGDEIIVDEGAVAPAQPRTVSPELEEVRRVQRGVDLGDPGRNMVQRMGAGQEVPIDVIGEGAGEAPQVYIVKNGDTLWDISSRFLNDPFMWTRIHADNPQIINPDLIYPGEPITVYPREWDLVSEQVVQLIPPSDLERATATDEEPVLEDEFATEVEFEVIEEVEPSAAELAERDQFLEQLTKRDEIEIFDEASTELISKKRQVLARRQRNVLEYSRAQSAGWLAPLLDGNELEQSGYIIGQEDEQARIRAATGDRVFINRGQINGVAAGDRFLIFRITSEVEHPVTGDYIGHQIKIVGGVQVEEVYERTSSAIITEAYEDVSVGNRRLAGIETYDRILPEFAVETDIRLKANEQEINGWIVGTKDRKLAMVHNDIVYLDKGAQDGVEVGNVFNIYRPNRQVEDPEVGDDVSLPRYFVGEAVVLRTNETTSTALITSSRREVVVGDQISIAPLELEPEGSAAESEVAQGN